VAAHSHLVLLAGDWNSGVEEMTAMSASSAFLGGLQRVALPAGVATGLNGDFSRQETIDHMLLSHGLELADHPVAVQVEKEPRSPWGPAGSVVGASDHVWISARVQLTATCVASAAQLGQASIVDISSEVDDVVDLT
jgi:hypothetical protein